MENTNEMKDFILHATKDEIKELLMICDFKTLLEISKKIETTSSGCT